MYYVKWFFKILFIMLLLVTITTTDIYTLFSFGLMLFVLASITFVLWMLYRWIKVKESTV